MPYDTATVIANTTLPDGRGKLTFRFSGAGEIDVDREIFVDGGTTVLSLKQWGISVKNGLNNADTVLALPGLQTGQVIDISDIVIPPSFAGYYVFPALAMAKGASKNYLTLFNGDADRVVQVAAVKLIQELSAAVVGLARGYRLLPINSHSGGTLVTAQKLDNNFPDLSANIVSRKDGVTVNIVGAPVGIESLNEEETGAAGKSAWLYRESDAGQPLILRQNQGIVVQQDAVAGNGLLSVLIYFRVD